MKNENFKNFDLYIYFSRILRFYFFIDFFIQNVWLFFSTKIFDSFSMKLFRSKNIFRKKSRSSISIPNFPKIPKIILRKIADEFRDTKNTDYKFLILDFQNFVHFYVALPLTIQLGRFEGKPQQSIGRIEVKNTTLSRIGEWKDCFFKTVFF